MDICVRMSYLNVNSWEYAWLDAKWSKIHEKSNGWRCHAPIRRKNKRRAQALMVRAGWQRNDMVGWARIDERKLNFWKDAYK